MLVTGSAESAAKPSADGGASLATSHDPSITAEAWQQVIVDRPERLLLILICTSMNGTAEWLGFAAKTDGFPDQIELDAPVAPVFEKVVAEAQRIFGASLLNFGE